MGLWICLFYCYLLFVIYSVHPLPSQGHKDKLFPPKICIFSLLYAQIVLPCSYPPLNLLGAQMTLFLFGYYGSIINPALSAFPPKY